jgi:hypothetical protein
MAAAWELVIADEPGVWEALGFAVGDDGAVALAFMSQDSNPSARWDGSTNAGGSGTVAER